jgi:hypothetical protein
MQARPLRNEICRTVIQWDATDSRFDMHANEARESAEAWRSGRTRADLTTSKIRELMSASSTGLGSHVKRRVWLMFWTSPLVVLLCQLACAPSSVELQQSITSPDGALVADYYALNAGGGAGSAVDVVRLRPANERFRADSGYSFFAVSADPVTVRWISNTELEVSYDERGHVRTSDQKWKNVTIRYRSNPPVLHPGKPQ